jgi:hypothetical protein
MDISRRNHVRAGASGRRSYICGVVAFAVTAALVGCAAGDSQEPADAQAVAPSTPAATVSASSAPSTAPAGDGLTGYGATREAWDSSHEPAPGYSKGAAFLPLVSGDQPRYASVSGEAGERIYSYTISFTPGTDLKQAKREVLREFPPGASFGVEDADEPRCLLMDIRSRQVEAVMDGYRPMVGFFTDSGSDEALDRDHVDSAIFILASPDETTDLGMC